MIQAKSLFILSAAIKITLLLNYVKLRVYHYSKYSFSLLAADSALYFEHPRILWPFSEQYLHVFCAVASLDLPDVTRPFSTIDLYLFGGRPFGLWYSGFDISGRMDKGWWLSWIEDPCDSCNDSVPEKEIKFLIFSMFKPCLYNVWYLKKK